jgi:hypothetical protein
MQCVSSKSVRSRAEHAVLANAAMDVYESFCTPYNLFKIIVKRLVCTVMEP